jgi:hypothetical protein
LELDGKSTAVHAVLLAPEQTQIFDNFVDVPDYRSRLKKFFFSFQKKIF